jgi:hypothetical protein
MIISKIYQKYQTPINLQEHMFRVAALAYLITDKWKGYMIDRSAIINCCLLHDIAKPITFDLTKQKQYGMSEKDIENLQNTQEFIKNKYGDDEHTATLNICQEISLSTKSLTLVDNLDWPNITKLLLKSDIESLIPIYCDMRISPHGIMTLDQRIIDLKKRTDSPDLSDILSAGEKSEQIIQSSTDLQLNSITNSDINKKILEFTNYNIG